MRVRGGSGGKFGNILLLNPTDKGLRNDGCGSETRTATLPAASVSIGTVADGSTSGYLYWSSNNVIDGATTPIDDDCTPSSSPFSFRTDDPLLSAAEVYSNVPIDPRPTCGGPAYSNVDSIPNGDSWFTTTTYKGAFGSDNWLSGWSFLDVAGQRGLVSSTYTCPTSNDPISLCGDITTDTTWQPGPVYIMTCQTFVKSGATLTIAPGTTIYATPVQVSVVIGV